MTGRFATYQPAYAAAGIATFPVKDKRPLVKGYSRVGTRASKQLAAKFADDDAFGFLCGRKSGLAVLDVDTPDEKVLADALNRYGDTPIVIRSHSGNWQAWYRWEGQTRQIRAEKENPIDILGGGYVVAPPSLGAKGDYEMVSGSLDDVGSLPAMRMPVQPMLAAALGAPVTSSQAGCAVRSGERNNQTWRLCMAAANRCNSMSDLMAEAAQWNAGLVYPLLDDELARIADSAWNMTSEGRNWFGREQVVPVAHSEIDDLLSVDPDAFILLTVLRRHHAGLRSSFVIANAMCDNMPGSLRRRQNFAAARARLEAMGYLRVVRPALRKAPAVYSFAQIGPIGGQGGERGRVYVSIGVQFWTGNWTNDPVRKTGTAKWNVNWEMETSMAEIRAKHKPVKRLGDVADRICDGVEPCTEEQAHTKLHPVFGNAVTIANFTNRNLTSPVSLVDAVTVMMEMVEVASKGSKHDVSDMLIAQMLSLNAVYSALMANAAASMDKHLHAAETYMRLAFKAQTQARQTADSLAKLHQPREQVVRHIHINQGGQAVVADQFHSHRGGRQTKTVEQPLALDAPCPPVPSSDALREAVPVTSGAGER